MTFYHFANCLALAYVPYHLTYKLSGMSEYGAFRRCIQAGCIYLATQLCKMLFLATFFPTSDYDEENLEILEKTSFSFFTEFFRLTVDLFDLAGFYFALQKIPGKGQFRVLIVGLGWAFAEILLTRVIFLWVGARGIEFDWKYIQKSIDANISLVHYITISCLVWLWMRKDLSKSFVPVLLVLLAACSYKPLLLDSISHIFSIGVWTALAYKTILTACFGLVTLQMYIGITVDDVY